MARVSKKVTAQRKQEQRLQSRIWKTAIYARLSNFESSGSNNNEETLEVQIAYIQSYLEKQSDMKLVDIFADKGFTGTNFSRPEFERLLRALQEKSVDCIIVKDFSRLGRNFVETGQYLEQVFPLLGVRFVAINDNYDSQNQQNREGMLVPIKGMMNELYSKDLSRKVKSSFRAREKNGEIYILPPFGYKRDEQNRGRLVLDEEVSDVVLQMFLWRKAGLKNGEIAKRLTEQGVPIVFKRRCELGYLNNTKRVARIAWNSEDVWKVLENPIYTGTMVYNRIAYDSQYRRLTIDNPREEWRMVPDNHPAIITWELFDEVQAIMESSRLKHRESLERSKAVREKHPNHFAGILYCRHCGHKINASWANPTNLHYACTNQKCAHKVSIKESDLWEKVNQSVHDQLDEQQKLAQRLNGKNVDSEALKRLAEFEKTGHTLTNEQLRLQAQKKNAYEVCALGNMSRAEYLALRDKVNVRLEEITLKQKENDEEYHRLQQECLVLKPHSSVFDATLKITPENLRQIVKRVELDEDNDVFVALNLE